MKEKLKDLVAKQNEILEEIKKILVSIEKNTRSSDVSPQIDTTPFALPTVTNICPVCGMDYANMGLYSCMKASCPGQIWRVKYSISRGNDEV